MNIRAFLAVNAILAAVHGVGFIVAPAFLLGFYQIAQAPGASLMGQLFGTELLVVAILCWLGRDFTSTSSLFALMLAGFIPNAVGAVICVWAVLGGVMGAMGWLGVFIYAGLALGHLAFLAGKGYRASVA